ncbi:GNAT family N-acetyltransferase [Kineosporia rhizophila]|uniref:GNAT family N-acetyltransferase n=1 Tax=Kineosporia TaxID=49184 RepID=UPI001E2C55AA|nr:MULTISPECIES: GNAT family N-acetyltransferase [Kineosporia]MCE0535211.1 GNAT family N-acetyltransferase [Kineosporia rhizophila]GLY17013.1 molybdopterin-guanine dinucleotide biosynthesis protein MobC [Kineosporia sp. NBRC 101677]
MEIRIHRAVPRGAEADAARLYGDAFGSKLRPGLGTGAVRERFLAAALRPDRMVCAEVDGVVCGVVGLNLDGDGAFSITWRSLREHYGASAWWRMLLLLPLHREPRKGHLLLDGIAVDARMRGRGVGGRLLDEVDRIAAEQGFDRIGLSVIDSNPRARALYERHGYSAARTERVGALGDLYGGFRSVTKMVKEVGA